MMRHATIVKQLTLFTMQPKTIKEKYKRKSHAKKIYSKCYCAKCYQDTFMLWLKFLTRKRCEDCHTVYVLKGYTFVPERKENV